MFGNKTCHITVTELKKCGKFETVLVQVVSDLQRKTTQNQKLALLNSPRAENLKENDL